MAPTTKASQKRLEAAVTAFNARYSSDDQWGQERWEKSLYPALAKPTTYCAVVNQYAVGEEEGRTVLSGPHGVELDRVEFPRLPCGEADIEGASKGSQIICYEQANPSDARNSGPGKPFPVPQPVTTRHAGNQILTHWNMDAASVLAAHLLDVQPGDRVLDMCAAPGGKTVVIAQKLFPHLHHDAPSTPPPANESEMGSLVVDEMNPARHKRLTANLKSYLPATLFPTAEHPRAPIRILNTDLSMRDAVSTLPRRTEGYDKILVDAPCSSERHIIHAHEKAKVSGRIADEMLNWKSSHVASLVKVQTGLLTTAIRALKVGGRLVYATCALGVEENDGVVQRALDNLAAERKRAKKNGEHVDNWEVQPLLGSESERTSDGDPILQRMSESTKYGRIALPDRGGWGPLYFSIMTKVERVRKAKPTSRSTMVQSASRDASTIETARSESELHEP